MTKLFDQKAILAKIEDTYATDASPVAANAILATNGRWEPIAGSTVSRNLEQPYQGGQEEVRTNVHAILTFDVELAGAGAAGDVPAWGVLMRAAGFSETVTTETDVVYAPVSADHESCTLYFNVDGIDQKFLGSRGSVSINAPANDYMKATFRILGRFAAPTDTAAPTVDYTAWIDPVVVNFANTSTFSIGAVTTLGLESYSLDMRTNVVARDLPNSRDIKSVARDPGGSVTVEADTLATFNPIALARAGTKTTMALHHGTVAGNIIQITKPKIQLQAPTPGNRDNVMNWQLPYKALPDAGNDEVIITVL
tara:strand:+ start:13191 stop:14120 length:930 start_codon:yes stop_codon:yes gene_type:complete